MTMTNSSIKSVLVLSLVFSLASCAKEDSGTLLGAVGGAFAGRAIGGNNLVSIAAGTLAGAYIGREIGQSLDKADREAMYSSTQTALETGQSGTTSNWHNPDSGNRGTVTPQPAYETTEGQYCREYQQSVTVGDKAETAYGTACRQPDGTWKIINS
jgi:surface antigen